MRIYYYICRVFGWFPRQTSEQEWFYLGTCHLYPCSTLVSEGAHFFNVPLQDNAGTVFSVFSTPQTSRHVLYCKFRCTTMCTGCDHVANPAFAIASPTPEVTCKAVSFSRLSACKSYTAWCHAKAIQQVAKRSVCWSI